MKRILVLVVLCVLVNCSSAFAQYFQHVQMPGSVEYSSVGGIAEDKDGRFWLLSGSEVRCYDGVSVRMYSDKIMDVTPQYTTYTHCLLTRSGDLYLASNNGMFIYEPERDNFKKVLPFYVRHIYEDASFRLWIAHGEVSCYNPESDECMPVMMGDKPVLGQVFTNVNCPYVFIVTDDGILQQDACSEQRQFHPIDFGRISIRALQYVDSTLYLLTERDGLWSYRNNVFEKVLDLDGNMVARHLEHQDSCLWIGTMQGLFSYQLSNGQLIHYRQSPAPYSLPYNSIQSLFVDSHNRLWIGFFSGGMALCQPDQPNRFEQIRMSEYNKPMLPVSALLEYKGKLYIGTEGDGLYCYEQGRGITAHYSTKNGLRANNIKSLVAEGDHIWIGTYLGGLNCLDLRTRLCSPCDLSQHNNSYNSSQIYQLCGDSSGLWIVYQSVNEMISHYNYATHEVEHYSIPRPEGENVSTRLRYIVQCDSLLYIATSSSLHCFSAADKQYRYSITPEEKIVITALESDEQHRCLWIGTKDNGIWCYDVASCTFEQQAQRLFARHTVYNIRRIQDVLWIGTDNGVYSHTISSQSFHLYNELDGVSKGVFSMTSSSLPPFRIYIGSAGVVNYVDCDKLTYNTLPPHTLLSDVMINGQSVYDGTPVWQKQVEQLSRGQLILNHKQNNIVLSFSCTNYEQPEKNFYRYRLNNGDWIKILQNGHTLSLVQLHPGKYNLSVQASNSDEVWGDVMNLQICVRPPFFLSIWGYLLWSLIFVALLLYIIHTTRSHYRQKQLLFEAEVYKKYCISAASAPRAEAVKKDLDKFQSLIIARISGHVDIDEVAREMGMSRRKLFDFVKKNTGKTIIEYVRHQRITMAAKLMVEQNMTSKQVMDAVGIESQSHFVKAFTAEFGKTPTEFMADLQEK